MKHFKNFWKSMLSLGMTAAMMAALSSTAFAAEGTYTAVSLTNAGAFSSTEDLYVQVGESYEKVTVGYTEGQTTTEVTYTDANGNVVDAANVQSTWTDSNGTTYTDVYEYTGESSSQPVYGSQVQYFTDVHTYTRTTNKVSIITYYYYVDDVTGNSVTSTSTVLSDTNARKAFLSYFEGTDYYTNGYKCVYGSYAFAIVKPVTRSESTTTTDAVYSYSASGMDTVTSTGADSATPVTLYTYTAHTHTAGEAVVENKVSATCTTDGSYDSVVYCTECGEEISRETVTVPATGHTAGEAVVENEVAATCTEDGSYDSVVYCTVCGEEISRETITVEATGHTAGEAVVENEVAATATEDGSYDSVVYCTVCGEEISRETVTIPATGHHYGDPTFEWAEDYSTCAATFACTDEGCDAEETIECTVTSEENFTCTEGGENVYTATCTFGEEEYSNTVTVEIDATGSHTYGNWTGNYDETIYRECSVCGEQEVAENPFTDLSDDEFYVAIVWASYYDITTGTTGTNYSPNGTCTREQIVTFLWRAAGCPEPTISNPFSDVSSYSVHYKAILWAYEKGITTGTTATTFSPSGTCTRAQIVTFLWRFAGSPEPTTTENPFSDNTNQDFYKAILWASENGITTGYSDGTFRPNESCSRAQAVTFLFRYYTELLGVDPQ